MKITNLNNYINNQIKKENDISAPKIYFQGTKDEFVKNEQKKLSDKEYENLSAFLLNVGMERFCTKLINGENWSNGSDIIYFVKDDNKIKNIGLNVYNFETGENEELKMSPDEFVLMLSDIKTKSTENNSDKKQLYEELYTKMKNKLSD